MINLNLNTKLVPILSSILVLLLLLLLWSDHIHPQESWEKQSSWMKADQFWVPVVLKDQCEASPSSCMMSSLPEGFGLVQRYRHWKTNWGSSESYDLRMQYYTVKESLVAYTMSSVASLCIVLVWQLLPCQDIYNHLKGGALMSRKSAEDAIVKICFTIAHRDTIKFFPSRAEAIMTFRTIETTDRWNWINTKKTDLDFYGRRIMHSLCTLNLHSSLQSWEQQLKQQHIRKRWEFKTWNRLFPWNYYLREQSRILQQSRPVLHIKFNLHFGTSEIFFCSFHCFLSLSDRYSMPEREFFAASWWWSNQFWNTIGYKWASKSQHTGFCREIAMRHCWQANPARTV